MSVLNTNGVPSSAQTNGINPVNGDNGVRVSQTHQNATGIMDGVPSGLRNLTSHRTKERKVEEVREARANDLSLTTAIDAEEKAKGKVTEAEKKVEEAQDRVNVLTAGVRELEGEVEKAQREKNRAEESYNEAHLESDATEAEFHLNHDSLFKKIKSVFHERKSFGRIQSEAEKHFQQLIQQENEKKTELLSAQDQLKNAEERLTEVRSKLDKTQVEAKIAIAGQFVAKLELAFREQERAYSERLFELRQTNSEIKRLSAEKPSKKIDLEIARLQEKVEGINGKMSALKDPMEMAQENWYKALEELEKLKSNLIE
ncbi:MAG: hypothetical protein ACSW8C_00590 [bacterium]